MVAEITKRMVPKWEAKCDECDVWLASILRPADAYLQRYVDEHNAYCHSDELLPHTVARTSLMLIGYDVECVCGATSHADSTNLADWRCRLDRTRTAA